MDDADWKPPEDEKMVHDNVPAYELLAILAAVATWGHRWEGRTLIFRCDNQGICTVVNRASRYTTNPDTNGILRQLFMQKIFFEYLFFVFGFLGSTTKQQIGYPGLTFLISKSTNALKG
jgi:hypothetical protein